MKNKIRILLAATALMLFSGAVPGAMGADSDRPMLINVLRDQPQDLENGGFLLEVAPCYYQYKTGSRDWFSAGLLFKADVGRAWEVSLGSDFLSYQHPDFGLSDIYVGAKWKFLAQDDWTMALSGYVLFPTGDKAFREPGIEPTLSLLVSRKLGDWELGLSVGSTYAADDQGDPNYLDLELNLEVDYTPDAKNSFSVFSSGYGPDQKKDGVFRTLVGASYTRTLTDHQSLSIMLMKGLSGRGLDWSGILTYSYTF